MHGKLPLATVWGLMSSVIVVLILGFSLFIYFMLKAKKLKSQIDFIDKAQNKKGINDILVDKKIGEMIWDLKEKSENPLDDESIEFFINSIKRNEFTNILSLGETQGYEIISLAKRIDSSKFSVLKSDVKDIKILKENAKKYNVNSKIKIIESVLDKENFDFIFFTENQNDLNKNFDHFWKNVKKNGLFIVPQANKKTREQKDLISYLKLTGMRYEIKKWAKWFIIAAK